MLFSVAIRKPSEDPGHVLARGRLSCLRGRVNSSAKQPGLRQAVGTSRRAVGGGALATGQLTTGYY